MQYIGIDPGMHGGIALLHGTKVTVWPMPSTELDIIQVMGSFSPECVATIEWIHPAIQGIGKSQMSKLYGNYMALRMALTALEISFEIVMPAKWQAGIGIKKRKGEKTLAWKDRLRMAAQQRFPSLAVWSLPLMTQRSVSDALLIAAFTKMRRR